MFEELNTSVVIMRDGKNLNYNLINFVLHILFIYNLQFMLGLDES